MPTCKTPALNIRRGARMTEEIAILLQGDDMQSKVFVERTKTVVLSRHGAGVVSRHRLAPETRITVCRLDANNPREARIVGLVEADSGSYIYGLAFLEPDIDFWGIAFPPEAESEQRPNHQLFECGKCKDRESVDLNDMESDIYAIHRVLARSCKRCGLPTVWKRARDNDSVGTSYF